MMATTAKDVMDKVAAAIIKSIEDGIVDGTWTRPWSGRNNGLPSNALTGKPYSGGNIMALWITEMFEGYRHSVWATYKQWEQLGAQVRRGETGTHCVKVTPLVCRDHGPDEQCDKCGRVASKSFVLFNADQVDGWQVPGVDENINPDQRRQTLDAFFEATGATIGYGFAGASYSPTTDEIRMPDFEAFKDADSFYATQGHELIHWTGAESRLKRDLSGRFGSNSYAMEELVAELGAAMLCATLGVTDSPRPDHAQYLKHWLEVLKEDSKALWSAASLASKAVQYVNPTTVSTSAPEEVPA